MPSIEIKDLKVTYYNDTKETLALNGVNVSFINNKIAAVIGPSGCGKTTLLRTICGFLDYEGAILSDGVDYSTINYKKRNMSYIDQSVTINPNIDIYNNIADPLIINKVNRLEIDKRIKKIALDFGIDRFLSLFPSQLSAGQVQLVLLAKAIVKEPDLLLFDEAFSGVDPVSKKRVFDVIKSQRENHPLTMIFVSHNYEEIAALADYVVVIDKGKVDKIIDRNDKMFNSLPVMMENNSDK